MEQLNGEVLSRRTDIYSWAVSVLEMFLGERPWQSGAIVGTACEDYFDMDMQVPLPEEMKIILQSCLNENPDARPHDFAEIDDDLLFIYEAQTGAAYPRERSKAAADTADSLNNKALSYLDLGKPVDAEKCWERALAATPNHAESLYNRCVFLLQRERMNQTEAIKALDGNPSERTNYFASKLYLAWSDSQNALERLNRAKNVEELTDEIRQMEDEARNLTDKAAFIKCERVFEDADAEISIRDNQLLTVRFSQDGKHILAGLESGKVKVWDAISGECIHTIVAYTQLPKVMCFSPDGRYAAVGSSEGDVIIWDIDKHECMDTFVIESLDRKNTLWNRNEINTLCFTRDGAKLAIGNDKELYIWDKHNKKTEMLISFTDTQACSFLDYPGANSDDGVIAIVALGNQTMAFCCQSGRIQIWDYQKKECVENISISLPKGVYISNASFNADASSVLLFSYQGSEGKWACWERSTGEILQFTGLTSSPGFAEASFSPDGKRALTWIGNKAYLWSISTGKCVFTIKSDSLNVSSLSAACFGADGNTVFFDRRLWRIPDHILYSFSLSQIQTSGKTLNDQAFFNSYKDAFYLFLSQRDIPNALAKLKDMTEVPALGDSAECWVAKREIARYCCQNAPIRYRTKEVLEGCERFRVSEDTSKALSYFMNEMELWDVETGQVIREFIADAKRVGPVCLNPDGSLALAVCDEFELALWDTTSGERIGQIFTDMNILQVYFSENGSYFFTYHHPEIQRGENPRTNIIKMWDAFTLECVYQSDRVSFDTDYEYTGLCFSSSCTKILHIFNQQVRLLDRAASEGVRVLCDDFPYGRYHYMGFSPDEASILIVDSVGMQLRDISMWDCIWSIEDSLIGRVCFSPDSTKLLTFDRGYNDNYIIKVRDSSTAKQICELNCAQKGRIKTVCFSPDSTMFLVGESNGFRLFDWRTSECVMEFERHGNDINSFKFNADGSRILLLCNDRINVLDLDYELRFPGWADWDDGALPYAQIFLALHPTYTEEEFDGFIKELQNRGYGWLRPEGVRDKLDELQFC